MNPLTGLDFSPLATLARQGLQLGAGSLVGYAVGRGWITADLGAQLVPLLVGLGVSAGTMAWAIIVKQRTNLAAAPVVAVPGVDVAAELAALRQQVATLTGAAHPLARDALAAARAQAEGLGEVRPAGSAGA